MDNDGFLSNSLLNRNANIGCGSTDSTPKFLCVIDSPGGDLDVLLFDINSTGSISGKYEYCIAGVSLADCISDLIYTPDRTTSGSIVKNSSSDRLDANDFSRATNTSHDHQQFENKDNSKVFNLKNESSNTTTEKPTSEVFEKIENSFEKILKLIR